VHPFTVGHTTAAVVDIELMSMWLLLAPTAAECTSPGDDAVTAGAVYLGCGISAFRFTLTNVVMVSSSAAQPHSPHAHRLRPNHMRIGCSTARQRDHLELLRIF
jgi:hypothetical protein